MNKDSTTPEIVGASADPVSFARTFRALRHRNFRLFFAGQLVSLIGTWMQQTAMSWWIYEQTGSKILLGVVSAAGSAPMVFLSLWGGSLADRYSKRRILIATQTASMLFAFLLAYLVWKGWAGTAWIIAISLLNGVAMAFDMPARQSFVVEMTSREDLMNAISLNSSVFNGARVIGPSLAGIAIAWVGTAMCFFLNGLSFLAVIAGLAMMRLAPAVISETPSASVREHATSGLLYAWSHIRVRTILILFAFLGVFGWSYGVLMPSFARDVLGLSAGGYGSLMSASGIGALCGALTIASAGHLYPPRKLAFGGIWTFSTMLILCALTRNFYFAMACLGLAGFGMMLFFSTANTVLQTIVPDEMRGRVMGIWALIFGAIVPLGSLEAGALAHWIGTRPTIGMGGIVCALAAGGTLISIHRRETASGPVKASEV